MASLQDALLKSDKIQNIDIHFAHLMQKLTGGKSDDLFLLSALVSSATREGHLCLALEDMDSPDSFAEQFEFRGNEIKTPSSEAAKKNLEASSVVGVPGAFKPLILDEKNRLYLNRYWNYQKQLSAYIKIQANETLQLQNPNKFKQQLQKYFPPSEKTQMDWQMVAACVAALKKFCIITGGPGTGKTYTTAKILALLIEDSWPNKLKIELAAPTGKAANRLQESVKQLKQTLGALPEILSGIPDEAKTIHRLLRTIPKNPHFQHNEKKPLDLDVLVVDEASMIDLALMAKLVRALPVNCRLILLGDNNQLASVEAGAVLADIHDAAKKYSYSKNMIEHISELTEFDLEKAPAENTGLNNCIVELKRSYRFEKQQGIGALSQAVNEGDSGRAVEILKDGAFPDVVWHDLTSESIGETTFAGFYQNVNFDDPEIAFSALDKTRILCAVRQGRQGVNFLNEQIEKIIRNKFKVSSATEWFAGQPIIVTQNDYSLKLFNGDVGLILPNSEKNGDLFAYFRANDGMIRKIRPARIQNCESAYAMTVHKSQGSEFENVILILPDKDSALLTRELIYTAITRASKKVDIWGVESVFHSSVQRKIKRASGLRDALLAQ